MVKRLNVISLFVILIELIIFVGMAFLINQTESLKIYEVWTMQTLILFVMGYRVIMNEYWVEDSVNGGCENK